MKLSGIEIGKLLKNARERQSLTQEQLAEKVGKKRSYISRIESESGNNINLRTVSQDQILFDVVQISEPDDDYAFDDCEDDDDLSLVAIPSDLAADGQHENEDDDERYYRPFRHHQYDGARHESKKNGNEKLISVKKQKQNNMDYHTNTCSNLSILFFFPC